MNGKVLNKCIFIILIFLVCFPAAMQAQANARNAFLYIDIRSDGNSDEKYRNIIIDAAKLEFENTRLIIRTLKPGTAPDPKQEIQESTAPEAVFLLKGIYSVQGSFLEISFSWSDLLTNISAEEFSGTFYIDLSLDQEISSLVTEIRDLKSEMINSIAFLPEQKDPEPEKPLAPAVSTKNPVRKNRNFQIKAGYSEFISTGRISEYSKASMFPTAVFSYILHPAFADIALGVVSGANIFKVSESGSENQFLIPVGINAAVQFRIKPKIQLSAGMSAGAAFMLITLIDELYSKTVFYTALEAGAAYFINKDLGIQLKVEYYIFFESPDPVMGFTPGLYLVYRL